jgi:hypothetical protein
MTIEDPAEEIVLSKASSLLISTTRMVMAVDDVKLLLTILDEPRNAVEKAVAEVNARMKETILRRIRDMVLLQERFDSRVNFVVYGIGCSSQNDICIGREQSRSDDATMHECYQVPICGCLLLVRFTHIRVYLHG